MRFNEKSSVLHYLDNGNATDFILAQRSWPIGRKLLFEQEIKSSFSRHYTLFSGNIKYITKPFYDAYTSVKGRLAEVLKEASIGEMKGTLIVPIDSGVVKTIFYWWNNHPGQSLDLIAYEFSRYIKTGNIVLESAIQVNSATEITSYYITDNYQVNNIKGMDLMAELIGMLTFLKCCQVETKIIEPRQKLREFGCRYFNETKRPIEIIDSTWFTTIVKSEGFGVRGHFRLQPKKKDGVWIKDLIWLKPYSKSGYTREARVLLERNPGDHE